MKALNTSTQNAVNKVTEKKTRTSKFSLCYILDMANANENISYTAYSDYYKRGEIVSLFNKAFNTNIL